MNTKLLQNQETVLAIAAKTTQRTALFIHSCTLIQEQQALIQRLVQHISDLNAELNAYETKRPSATDATAIPAETPLRP